MSILSTSWGQAIRAPTPGNRLHSMPKNSILILEGYVNGTMTHICLPIAPFCLMRVLVYLLNILGPSSPGSHARQYDAALAHGTD